MKNAYKFFIIALFMSATAENAHALKFSGGLGGYSPFSFTTQTESDGGKSVLRMKPTLFVNALIEVPFGLFAMPEFGWVIHGSGVDDYSKNTYYLLGDLVYTLNPNIVLRYGYGLFMTRIGGDGEAIQLNNGGGYSTFYTAGDAIVSYNSTVNLGVEFVIKSDATFRVQTFLFEPFNSVAREFSYMLSYSFFFDGGSL